MKSLLYILLLFSLGLHSQILTRDFTTGEGVDYKGHNYRSVKIAQADEYYNVSWKSWLLDDIVVNDLQFLLDKKTQESQSGCGHHSGAVVDSGRYTYRGAMLVCPSGWRLPRLGEWDTLLKKITLDQRAFMFSGQKGFKGYHNDTVNSQIVIGTQILSGGFWWTTEAKGERAYVVKIHPNLFYETGVADIWDNAAVRCVRDEE